MSVENKYRERLMEGMLTKGLAALALFLTGRKTRAAVKDLRQKINDDPSIKATMDSLDQLTKELDRKIDSYCERNPDAPACIKRRK